MKTVIDLGDGLNETPGTFTGEFAKLVRETYEKEPPVFRTDGPRADLAVAYPLSDDIIGFTLTVAGKPQQFTMKRSAAASFIGRMAEVLAK
jgi:hypothetical protein